MKKDLVLIQGIQQTFWNKNYSLSLSDKSILAAF